jgi:hypothetical protein
LHFIANKYLHAWHWLASGNNATAVATVTAILAFIGLWFYTVYARRMMQIAQETRRAETYPYFVIRGEPLVEPQHMRLELMNIGGNAAKVEGWGQNVSDQFRLASVYFERGPSVSENFYGAILKNEKLQVEILRSAATRTLMVLNCTDTRQGRHQFAMLMDWNDYGHTVEGRMLHPDVFLPFWQRRVTRIRGMIFLARRRRQNKK